MRRSGKAFLSEGLSRGREANLELRWEDNFSIAAHVDEDGVVVISANREGLMSLANLLHSLAAEPSGAHVHLDEHNSLEDGSREVIIERV